MGEDNMSKYIIIVTTGGRYEFYGEYLSDMESRNWHYYRDVDGAMYHFRKEHMVAVIEKQKPIQAE